MNYYRKPIDKTINDVRLKMQMAAFTLKLSENNDKIDDLFKADKDIKKDITDNSNSIKNFYTKQDVNNIISQYYLKKYLYDKTYIDNNFLVKSEIDKKDNEILNKVNNNFYSRSYINDNYYIKNNVYDKNYIDTKIGNIYDKNYINLLANNLYNRTYLDGKFNDIYSKTEVNNKNAKLDRNIVLFNSNLTKFIDETYKNDKEVLEGDIKENKNKFDNFIMNTFSTFSNNISNINNSQNSRLSDLESKNLSDTQITKINELENIDLEKINKYSYYIKEFFMHNMDLVRRFNITSELDFIQVLQFEIDRNFLVNDIIKFFISIKFLYENMKMYWVLYFKIDVHYKDDVLIKSFKRQMTSKGFIFKNLVTFNIDNMFKLNKQTDRLIFKLYMCKVTTAYKSEVTITLSNTLEENYCNLIWYRNQ